MSEFFFVSYGPFGKGFSLRTIHKLRITPISWLVTLPLGPVTFFWYDVTYFVSRND